MFNYSMSSPRTSVYKGLEVSEKEARELEKKIEPYLFLNFSPEILQSIVETFSYRDIIALCLASREFQTKICDDQSFWRMLYIRDASRNIEGITDFKKEYHKTTINPLSPDGRPNKKAWTDRGYKVFMDNGELYGDVKKDYQFQSLHALDHRWERRFVKVSRRESSKYYFIFLIQKGDLNMLDSLVSFEDSIDPESQTRLHKRVQSYIFKYGKRRDMFKYGLELEEPSSRRVRELQENIIADENVDAMRYLITKYPPTEAELIHLRERAQILDKQNILQLLLS